MSLFFVDVALIGGGLLLGRWVVRTIRARHPEEGGRDAAAGPTEPERDPFEGFPCKLGDVLVRVAERDEAWLAGALVLAEERPVAILFIAPEAGGDRAVLVREAPGSPLAWLSPLPRGELVFTGEPPHSLEHAGERFERVRRLPVKISRLGSGAPSVGEQGIVAEYEGAGAARIVVLAAAQMLAWKGSAVGDGEYDVLPGDGSKLED